MDKLAHYQQKWSLEAPHLIAQTATSSVYLVEQHKVQVVLKLLSAIGIHDEQRGAIALQYFNGQGTAHLLNASDDAHLLEYLHGDDLVSLVTNGRDDEAAHIIANVVTTFHAVKNSPIPDDLHTLRRRFHSLFQLVETDTDTLFEHGAQVAERLLAREKNTVVLHGDIHHWNIRQSTRGWLAFDPKGLVGENTYDIVNALLNPINMPQLIQDEDRLLRHAYIYADALKISPQRVLDFAFAHTCLSIAWSMEDGKDYADALLVARLIEKHVT